MKKNLKFGLFGFGCVGQGLYHVLHETKGVKAEIKKICVKTRNKPRPLGEDISTFDKEAVLTDPDIDVIVELIDDARAAFDIVKRALQNGKAVVTANKKMLAENLEEIYALQQRYGRRAGRLRPARPRGRLAVPDGHSEEHQRADAGALRGPAGGPVLLRLPVRRRAAL